MNSEQAHLLKVLSAFGHYKSHAMSQNHRRRRDYLSLSQHYKDLIPTHLEKINKIDACIEENMILIRDIMTNMFLDSQPMMDAQVNNQIMYLFLVINKFLGSPHRNG